MGYRAGTTTSARQGGDRRRSQPRNGTGLHVRLRWVVRGRLATGRGRALPGLGLGLDGAERVTVAVRDLLRWPRGTPRRSCRRTTGAGVSRERRWRCFRFEPAVTCGRRRGRRPRCRCDSVAQAPLVGADPRRLRGTSRGGDSAESPRKATLGRAALGGSGDRRLRRRCGGRSNRASSRHSPPEGPRARPSTRGSAAVDPRGAGGAHPPMSLNGGAGEAQQGSARMEAGRGGGRGRVGSPRRGRGLTRPT